MGAIRFLSKLNQLESLEGNFLPSHQHVAAVALKTIHVARFHFMFRNFVFRAAFFAG